MSERSVADDLESALLERARRLADEHLDHARQIREQIIQEENDRLRLREEREVLSAKDTAEREYQRQVQASELQLREKLERQRWDAIQEVMRRLADRLQALAGEEERYLAFLKALMAEAARRIPADQLVTELNERDLTRFQSRWSQIAREAVPGKSVSLDEHPCGGEGGLRLRDRDNQVLVDNTFEGRTERLADALHQVIAERLFARAAEIGELQGG